jgi:hypothetical protein
MKVVQQLIIGAKPQISKHSYHRVIWVVIDVSLLKTFHSVTLKHSRLPERVSPCSNYGKTLVRKNVNCFK